jgi:MFS family permease
MLAASLLARTGATMAGLSIGIVAYEQTASAFTVAVVAAGADVTWLTIFSFIAGLASAFIFVGSQMLLHGVAPGEHLQRVVSLDAATMSVSRIAGPALGGILLAAIGIPPVFLIAAFCYLPLLAVVPILVVGKNDQ